MTQPMFSLDQISDLVSRQVNEILAKRGGLQFTQDERDRLETVDAQVQGLLMDTNLGRVMSGPTWMSGISVIDGSITAEKITVNDLEALQVATGSLNVTGTITAAAAFPATGARITVSSAGIRAYQSDGVTSTLEFNVDGSGQIGSVAGSRITWTSGGVLTVPAAIISSLTIASVTSGTLGGTYSTSGSNPRIQFSTSGITVTNAGGDTTFSLVAATGAMTATGSFTVKSTSTGAHITIDNAGGIAGYNATSEIAGNRTFLINATDGSGHLGISGITWTGAGSVSIPGSLLVNGTVTAGKLSVSNLAAINADLGTITAGTINASNVTVSNLSFTNIQQTGTLGAAQNVGTVDISVNSTGKIKWEGGASYVDSNGMVLGSAGVSGDSIQWIRSGFTPLEKISTITGTSQALLTLATQISGTGRNTTVSLNAGGTDSGTSVTLRANVGSATGGGAYLVRASGLHEWEIDDGNVMGMTLERTNRALSLYGRLYPGTGSATQTSRYIADLNSRITFTGQTDFASHTVGGSAANWSSFGTANIPDASAGYVLIYINNVACRIPFYANA